MPHGQFLGQPVPVPAGSGVPPYEGRVLLSAPGQRDGHAALGEEELLPRWSQVEGQAGEDSLCFLFMKSTNYTYTLNPMSTLALAWSARL